MEDNRSNEEPETAAFFEELRALQRNCGAADKNDAATVLIHACIANGWDTRRRIVGALGCLGFKHGHLAIILHRGAGDWSLDSEGRYSSIE